MSDWNNKIWKKKNKNWCEYYGYGGTVSMFWKKKYFWMSDLRDTCHIIYIILFTLSEWSNHPWHLPMMPDCDWFNFIPWFQHIFIFRKYQNTPAAFRGGNLSFCYWPIFPAPNTHCLLAWHIAHFNTSIHQRAFRRNTLVMFIAQTY